MILFFNFSCPVNKIQPTWYYIYNTFLSYCINPSKQLIGNRIPQYVGLTGRWISFASQQRYYSTNMFWYKSFEKKFENLCSNINYTFNFIALRGFTTVIYMQTKHSFFLVSLYWYRIWIIWNLALNRTFVSVMIVSVSKSLFAMKDHVSGTEKYIMKGLEHYDCLSVHILTSLESITIYMENTV